MVAKQELIKFVIGAIVLLSTAVLFVSIAYGIYDSTRARQGTEKVAEERAISSQRRIDSLLMSIDNKNGEIADLKYQLGAAEMACPQVINN
jgi:hypothetical protein